ncbi:MAG: hypothetical protein MUE53_03410 [Chitinophagales bacterium]|jgi:hypothetical protein|nr:hypothetical protein [Chitinophagales bacterium]
MKIKIHNFRLILIVFLLALIWVFKAKGTLINPWRNIIDAVLVSIVFHSVWAYIYSLPISTVSSSIISALIISIYWETAWSFEIILAVFISVSFKFIFSKIQLNLNPALLGLIFLRIFTNVGQLTNFQLKYWEFSLLVGLFSITYVLAFPKKYLNFMINFVFLSFYYFILVNYFPVEEVYLGYLFMFGFISVSDPVSLNLSIRALISFWIFIFLANLTLFQNNNMDYPSINLYFLNLFSILHYVYRLMLHEKVKKFEWNQTLSRTLNHN